MTNGILEVTSYGLYGVSVTGFIRCPLEAVEQRVAEFAGEALEVRKMNADPIHEVHWHLVEEGRNARINFFLDKKDPGDLRPFWLFSRNGFSLRRGESQVEGEPCLMYQPSWHIWLPYLGPDQPLLGYIEDDELSKWVFFESGVI